MRYSPWRHVGEHPDVLVVIEELEHADAYWHPGERVILLSSRLTQVQRRWHLAHELSHLERGDECCCFGPDGPRLDRRQEARADSAAALALIDLDALADAMLWARNEPELAEVLHVPVAAVRARLRDLTDAEAAYIDSRIAAQEGAA